MDRADNVGRAPEDVAMGLTDKQRAAFPYLSEKPASFISINVAARTRRALVQKGLLIETRPPKIMGFYTWHLSELGLAVRQILIAEK